MTATRCTAACWASPICTVCRKRKAPRGRSVPMEAANSYCSSGQDCDGYYQPPHAGHLWPGEDGDPIPEVKP